MGRVYPLPSRLESLGKRRKSPEPGPGAVPAENIVGPFLASCAQNTSGGTIAKQASETIFGLFLLPLI